MSTASTRAQQFRGAAQARPTLALPDKPSIAVLPFTNLSGDPEQDFFGDGIAEDILTDLAKLHWLFVIARNSSFTFRGKAVDVRVASRELGVRYVLESSVRRAGDRIRVTVQLIDATTGAHVWASRYDRDLADIFAVQDEITATIAAAIAPAIIGAEQQRALRKSAEHLDAWEAYHRGLWHFWLDSREHLEIRKGDRPRPWLRSGLCRLAGITFRMAYSFQAMSLSEAARAAERLARQALALDPALPVAYAWLGQAMRFIGDLEGCIQHCDHGLSIDGNCAQAHGHKGSALVFAGRRGEGRQSLRACLRLDPRGPIRVSRFVEIAVSHYLDGDYELSAEASRQVLRQYPDHGPAYRFLLALLGQLDRRTECEALMKIAPAGYDHYARHRPPWFGLKDFEHMLDALRKAGWSE